MKIKATVFSTLVVLALAQTVGAQQPPQNGHRAQVPSGMTSVSDYGVLPLSFEPNHGQTGAEVHFLSRGQGYTLFLTSTGAVLALPGPSRRSPMHASRAGWVEEEDSSVPAVVRMKLLGANPDPRITGVDDLPAKSNYFIGNNPKAWRTNVPHFAGVRYEEVYAGIDLVFHANPAIKGQLEYDFIVAPSADPSVIRLSFQGAESIRLDPDGSLLFSTTHGEVTQHAPVVYQEFDGARQLVAGSYMLEEDGEVAFHVAPYDPTLPLIIDPGLAYSTYLGGSDQDSGRGIAVDASGNVYVVGQTSSIDFPATAGAFDQTNTPARVHFVAKLDATGSSLLYATYIGDEDSGGDDASIAIDPFGNAYIAGSTNSPNFPTTPGALDRTFYRNFSSFVTKLNPNGSSLVYSTYLWQGAAYGIAVDAAGNAYVTGITNDADFPVTPSAFDATFNGGYCDAFVAELDASGSSLLYATFLGGSGPGSDFKCEGGHAIAVDHTGYVYVTGRTSSPDFPTTSGAFDTSFNGDWDVFVTKLDTNAMGADSLAYSTFLGGGTVSSELQLTEWGRGMAADAVGNVYVTGQTQSPDFPTTAGAFDTSFNGYWDAFLAKLDTNAIGTDSLVYSTFLGGSDYDDGLAIALHPSGAPHASGSTVSVDFPTTSVAHSRSRNGAGDAFVVALNATGTSLLYSSYLGGSNPTDAEHGKGIALDNLGNVYVTGRISSSDFPTTAGAFDTSPNGFSDAFVVKLGAFNTAPLADAGDDQMVACTTAAGTPVALDGSGSSDPEGDDLTYTWTGSFSEGDGTVTGVSPTVTLLLGSSTITLVVNDGQADSEPDTVDVTVAVGVAGLQPPLLPLVPEGEGALLPGKAFKQGRALPLKLQLSCGGSAIADDDVPAPRIVGLVREGDAINLETIDPDAGEANDNGLLFRYSGDNWVYNLSTQGLSAGTYVVTIQLPDGLRYSAAFVLR